MKIPYNYLPQQFNDEETDLILEKVRALVKTGDFTLGAPVLEFETRLQKMLGVSHVIGTNSGTEALILALRAFNIGPGDEVITQANTFCATACAIAAVGARPVFVDVDDCYAIDETKIEAAITPRTKALMPVWWTGLSPNWPPILDIAKWRRLVVVEDACNGFGATFDGLPPGSFGDAAAFSLHPMKQLHVWGDGGAVVTNDDRAGKWLRQYRNYGLANRDELAMWGVNARLQSVQAVVALHGLDKLEAAVQRRNEIAARLDDYLRYIPQITVPSRHTNRRQAFQIYVVRAQQRDALLRYLVEHFVEAKVHYPVPVHLQPPARALGYQRGDCPVAERQAGEILTLPAHEYLTTNGIPGEDMVEHMIWLIRRFYEHGDESIS